MYVVEDAKIRMFVVEGEMVYSQKESPKCFLLFYLLSYVHLEEQVLSPVSQDLSKRQPMALWAPQLSISANS
jgi:hypothetical protein